ncbi:Rhomboid family protein [Babesia bovis T2Bo]|uniref:Rhomboid-like peptidase, putative n=1 Tax=Babesia bovis TaxID=5865 RepID=A7AQX1_BABBO|nr:Rhomboid family protein [Babesia bovis T2Bo]EDO06940.1 Rhomboid family protein [Babesia bovis T2Bo]|eukprot:XP_001610508.1 rhomboid-like peptidase [Babesia bovis T2Bo]
MPMYITINLPDGDKPEEDASCDTHKDEDDLGLENVVSRQRKYTVEFDKSLAMCVEQFNNLLNQRSCPVKVLRCANSAYNLGLSISRLDVLRRDYVSCSYCTSADHYPVNYFDNIFDEQTDSEQGADTSRTSESSTRGVNRYVAHADSPTTTSMQDIFLYPTQNIIKRFMDRRTVTKLVRSDAHYIEVEQSNTLSDYVVYMVGSRIEEQPLLRSIWENTQEVVAFLRNNLFPWFRIFRVSILITFAQWTLFIVRLVYSHTHPDSTEEHDGILFGAFSGELLKKDFAIYRLISSTFFHNSGGHLIISTIMHFRFSSVLERIHGPCITLFVYFLCSIYGMLGTCWVNPEDLQANGFAGDWGVAGALLSRYFMFPYLIDREHQHLINVFVSLLCLLFAKTIAAVTKILLSTHLLSALAGFCLGTMINNRLIGRTWCGIPSLVVDFLCSFTLLVVPVGSIFALSLLETT